MSKCTRCSKTFDTWKDYHLHACNKQYVPMDPEVKKLIVNSVERKLKRWII